MKRLPPLLSWIVLALASALAGIAFLQPWSALASPSGITLLATATSDFTYQGRLTNALGQPVPNGNYSMTFRLYDSATAATPLATATANPTVTNGLFVVSLSGFAGHVDGKDLYIGVQVGGDPELSPRQRITPVPYALSLRPGAVISDSITTNIFCLLGSLCPPRAVLNVRNTSTNPPDPFITAGAAIAGRGNQGIGVWGGSETSSGVVGETLSTAPGTAAVAGFGPTGGNAFYAGGSGKIASEATTTIFINGASFVKDQSIDTTRWNIQVNGGAQIFSGAPAGGTRLVYYPLNLPSRLYGTNATIERVRIHYRVSNAAQGYIQQTFLYRGSASGGFLSLASDITDRASTSYTSYTLTPTGNNVLPADAGAVLLFYLAFTNDAHYVEIVGISVDLKYI
ncbi:MAG: hypothetical protein RMM58_07825 [Chloroflexota bacterium]|nr:hypothetical protein [Chloroflexota bacterium]